MAWTTRYAFIICAFTYVSVLVWIGIYSMQLSPIKDVRGSIDFRKWINRTVGDLEKRRHEWNEYVVTDEKRHRKRLPDLIGIGVRKCGTGAIQDFIGRHPLIQALHGEPKYFFKHGYERRGLDYYRSLMLDATEEQIVAEKSPAYFAADPEDLPRIIDQKVPGVKIWLTICDPAARAFSDFAMMEVKAHRQADEDQFRTQIMASLHKIEQSFSYAKGDLNKFKSKSRILNVSDQDYHIFSEGVYVIHIERWLRVFTPDRLLVIDGEEILRDPGPVIERLQDFLRLPKLLLRKDFVRHPQTGLYCLRPWWTLDYDFVAEYHQDVSWVDGLHCLSKGKGRTRSRNAAYTLPQSLTVILQKFYQPYNSMLYELLDRKFHWQ